MAERGNEDLLQWALLCSEPSGQTPMPHYRLKLKARKLEKELMLEKDVQVCPPLLALQLADKVEEQGNQLKNFMCRSEEGTKCHGLRSQHLRQSLVGMQRGGIPGK